MPIFTHDCEYCSGILKVPLLTRKTGGLAIDNKKHIRTGYTTFYVERTTSIVEANLKFQYRNYK
jgi:hypothetical protein